MITISDLAKKHNYLSNIPFLFDSSIWEYDISQANINALRAFNRISEEDYQRLSMGPKTDREVTVGKWIRDDRSIQDTIYKGIEIAKLNLMSIGKITPDMVLRIANDSLFVISSRDISNNGIIPVNVNDTQMIFKVKGYYTYYMKFKKEGILFFFGPGDENGYEVNVIGINNDKLYLHTPFISFLCNLCSAYNTAGKYLALKVFNNFYVEYINRRLGIEYYREFNANSGYRFATHLENFLLMEIDPMYIDRININYNLDILRTIYSYLIGA